MTQQRRNCYSRFQVPQLPTKHRHLTSRCSPAAGYCMTGQNKNLSVLPILPPEIGGMVDPLHHLKSGGVLKGFPEPPGCSVLQGDSVNPGSGSAAPPSQQKSNSGGVAAHSAPLRPLEGNRVPCTLRALVPSPERGVNCTQIHCHVPKIEVYGQLSMKMRNAGSATL